MAEGAADPRADPFAPGGVPDIISRIVTPKRGEGLGQSFVIDNKPGAGGGLAGQLLAQRRPATR